jgi:hypothetical protein
VGTLLRLLALLLIAACAAPPPARAPKAFRTAAQRKIDSALLSASPLVRYDEHKRALVTIRAIVSDDLLHAIVSSGGVVISSSAEYHDIRAAVPPEQLERLAARDDVRAILPLEQATTQ